MHGVVLLLALGNGADVALTTPKDAPPLLSGRQPHRGLGIGCCRRGAGGLAEGAPAGLLPPPGGIPDYVLPQPGEGWYFNPYGRFNADGTPNVPDVRMPPASDRPPRESRLGPRDRMPPAADTPPRRQP